MSDQGDEFWERIRRQRVENQKQLEEKKREATARGKEPFDLDALEKLHDTSEGEGLYDRTREEKIAAYEDLYYVVYERVMTIAEFARALAERLLHP